MKPKYQYLAKYIAFRAIPNGLFFAVMSAMMIFLVGTTGNSTYDVLTQILCGILCAAFALRLLFRVFRFLGMIRRQEEQYHIRFDDNHAKVLGKWSAWIVCTDQWLIRPGRFAICRKEIQKVSMGDAYHEKGGIRFPIRVRTQGGQVFRIRFSNETDARCVRSWFRR